MLIICVGNKLSTATSTLRGDTTLSVAPSGTPNPVNPLVDAFDTLQSAYLWAKGQNFALAALLTINCAAGVYQHTQELDFTGFPKVAINGTLPTVRRVIPSQSLVWTFSTGGALNMYETTLTLTSTTGLAVGNLVRIVHLVQANTLNLPEAACCGVLKIKAVTPTTITVEQQWGRVYGLRSETNGSVRANTIVLHKLDTILEATGQESIKARGVNLSLTNIALTEAPIAGGTYPQKYLLDLFSSNLVLRGVDFVGAGIQTPSYENVAMAACNLISTTLSFGVVPAGEYDGVTTSRMGDYASIYLTSVTLQPNCSRWIDLSYGPGKQLCSILGNYPVNCIDTPFIATSESYFWNDVSFLEVGTGPIILSSKMQYVNVYVFRGVTTATLDGINFASSPCSIRVFDASFVIVVNSQNASGVTYSPAPGALNSRGAGIFTSYS